jgi:tetratricopeptide (TPR) repeat protein
MDAVQYRSVEEIAEVLQDMKSRGRSCSLLVGAGVSIAAGIPTAAGFVEIIRDRYKHAYARAVEKTYPQCMAELLPTQRRNLIGEYVDKARINWAHIGIALLMKGGYIDRVLTTNFDLLVVRACALLGLYPAAYDFAASQMLKSAELPEQAVFYLHGQRTGFVLMNTVEDMKSHSRLLGPVFEDAGNGRTWIVVGYSGANDPVFEHLAQQPRFDNGLFWVGNRDREPQAHVRERLLTCGKDAFLTKGHDADSFFVSLTRALQIFPPDVVARPFTYVRRALEQITPFVHPGQTNEEDVMRTPNLWIENAIEQFEKPAWQLITREAGAPPDALTDRSVIVNAVQYLSLQGNYQAVVAFRKEYEKDHSPELADLISMAYVVLGNRLHDQAKLQPPGQAEALFASAREMYKMALSIKPDRHEALHNWANLLLDLAKASSVDDAERYFAEAETLFSQASSIKPDQPEILLNWGNLLLDWAKAGTRRDAGELFLQAEQKYREALAISPALAGVHYCLGNLLLDRAKIPGPRSEELFTAAEEQYGSAISSDPKMAEAYYQWGNVYLDRAKRSEGDKADHLFEVALAKFQQALQIKPDMYQALNNWGNVLMDQGKTKEGEARDLLFTMAYEKHRQATLMRPDF